MEYLDTELGCVLLVKSCLCEERKETLEKVQPQTCPNSETQSDYKMLTPHMSLDYNSSALWLKKLQDEESLTRVKQRQDLQPTVGRKTRSVELLSL